MKDLSRKPWLSLLPIAVFILIFVGCGAIFNDFYMMPASLAFLIALFAGLLQNRKERFEDKLKTAAAGAGDPNIITMCLIYLLAGVFSGTVTAAGGVTSTVNLALSFIPAQFSAVGLFLMSCFISMAMGTSVGTISALAPISVEIAAKTGYSGALCIGAVVCGAMFGDNLSMISDTTIAAVRTQGCSMKDKFRANIGIAAIPALITALIFFLLTGNGAFPAKELPYYIVQIIPYLFILIGAVCGINVFPLLIGGTAVSVLIGLATGSLTASGIFTAMGSGISGMYEITVIAILTACISALIRHNGGFDWILTLIKKRLGGVRAAQFGIVVLVSLMDIAAANNTIAIVLAGPLASQLSAAYGISAKRSASLLDIFGSVVQGIIPYGAQLLSAAALTGLTPIAIMPYLYYPILLGVSAILFITFSRNRQEHKA